MRAVCSRFFRGSFEFLSRSMPRVPERGSASPLPGSVAITTWRPSEARGPSVMTRPVPDMAWPGTPGGPWEPAVGARESWGWARGRARRGGHNGNAAPCVLCHRPGSPATDRRVARHHASLGHRRLPISQAPRMGDVPEHALPPKPQRAVQPLQDLGAADREGLARRRGHALHRRGSRCPGPWRRPACPYGDGSLKRTGVHDCRGGAVRVHWGKTNNVVGSSDTSSWRVFSPKWGAGEMRPGRRPPMPA